MREQFWVPTGDQAAFGAAAVLLKTHSTYVQLADRLPETGTVGWPGEQTREETSAHHLLLSHLLMSGKASNLDLVHLGPLSPPDLMSPWIKCPCRLTRMLCSPYPLALSKVPFVGITDPGRYKQLPETFHCARCQLESSSPPST